MSDGSPDDFRTHAVNDDPAENKKHCGAFVVMKSGKRYLFEPGESKAEYVYRDLGHLDPDRHGPINDPLFVQVTEKGNLVFEALAEDVECIGGETWFFKDAWWGKQ